MLRYNEDIRMIEFLNDGHLIVFKPDEAARVVRELQKLIHFHDELGFEQSGLTDHIAYCNEHGKSFEGSLAILPIQPTWSPYRTHNEAIARALENQRKHGETFTHYRLMRRNTQSDTLYPTGVSE